MRRLLATVLLVALPLSLTGCGSSPTAPAAGAPMIQGKTKDAAPKKVGPPAPPPIQKIE